MKKFIVHFFILMCSIPSLASIDDIDMSQDISYNYCFKIYPINPNYAETCLAGFGYANLLSNSSNFIGDLDLYCDKNYNRIFRESCKIGGYSARIDLQISKAGYNYCFKIYPINPSYAETCLAGFGYANLLSNSSNFIGDLDLYCDKNYNRIFRESCKIGGYSARIGLQSSKAGYNYCFKIYHIDPSYAETCLAGFGYANLLSNSSNFIGDLDLYCDKKFGRFRESCKIGGYSARSNTHASAKPPSNN